jgi:uncharacterized iron-regulated membrane protein
VTPPWFFRMSFATIFAVAVWVACARQLWWERRAAGAPRRAAGAPRRAAQRGAEASDV